MTMQITMIQSPPAAHVKVAPLDAQVGSLSRRASRIARWAGAALVVADLAAVGVGVFDAVAQSTVPAQALTEVMVPESLAQLLGASPSSESTGPFVQSMHEFLQTLVIGILIVAISTGLVWGLATGSLANVAAPVVAGLMIITAPEMMARVLGVSLDKPQAQARSSGIDLSKWPHVAAHLQARSSDREAKAFVVAQSIVYSYAKNGTPVETLGMQALMEQVAVLQAAARAGALDSKWGQSLYVVEKAALGSAQSEPARAYERSVQQRAQRFELAGKLLTASAALLATAGGAAGALAWRIARRVKRIGAITQALKETA